MNIRTRNALVAAGLAAAVGTTMLALPDSGANTTATAAIASSIETNAALCETSPALASARATQEKVWSAADTATALSAEHDAALAVAAAAVDVVPAAEATAAQAQASLNAAGDTVTGADEKLLAQADELAAAAGTAAAKTVKKQADQLESTQKELAAAAKAQDASRGEFAQAQGTAQAEAAFAESTATSAASLAEKAKAAQAAASQAVAEHEAAVSALTTGPVVLSTQSLEWATGENKEQAALAHLCGAANADFVLVQDAAHVNVPAAAPAGLRTVQNDTDGALAGTAIGWREAHEFTVPGHAGPVDASVPAGADAGLPAGGAGGFLTVIDTTIDGQATRIVSVNYADQSATDAVKVALAARPSGSQWIVGGDFAQDPAAVGTALGGTAVGGGAEGFVVSDGLSVEEVSLDRYADGAGASAHPAVVVSVQAS